MLRLQIDSILAKLEAAMKDEREAIQFYEAFEKELRAAGATTTLSMVKKITKQEYEHLTALYRKWEYFRSL